MKWHHWLILLGAYSLLAWAVLDDGPPVVLRLVAVAACMSSTFFTGLSAGVYITREIFRG